MSHKLTIFLDKDGTINEGLYWANHTKEFLELLTYNDDIQVYWGTVWFWSRNPKDLIKSWESVFGDMKTYQEFYYNYYINYEKKRAKKYGLYCKWEEYKEKTKDFYKVIDDFYVKCKWHPMREKKTTILEVLKNDEPFLWIEDGNPQDEMNDIMNTKNGDYFYMNLDRNPDQLLLTIEYIKNKLLYL